nr:bifunctional indole-3-glycerol phosphate synthase/phosphoribosylanthranilate isomerase [Vibrio cholerae]
MSELLSEHISVQTAHMAQVLVKFDNDKYQLIEERKTKQPLASFHPLLTRSERD